MNAQGKDTVEARLAALTVVNKVLLEMLIRADAVSYHQVDAALESVLSALGPTQTSTASSARATLEDLKRFVEFAHQPRALGEGARSVDWSAEVAQG